MSKLKSSYMELVLNKNNYRIDIDERTINIYCSSLIDYERIHYRFLNEERFFTTIPDLIEVLKKIHKKYEELSK